MRSLYALVVTFMYMYNIMYINSFIGLENVSHLSQIFFLCPNHSLKKLKSFTSTDHQCQTSFMSASDQKL